MTRASAVVRVPAVRRLASQLAALGVRPGQDLLVHCSIRRIGLTDARPIGVLPALLEAIGPDATLVVPSQTTANSTSSELFRAATAGLSKTELARYLASMPGFDPDRTPSANMGVLAELVRTTPGAARSAHPQSSFAATGARAAQSMAGHELTCHLGEKSPLGWLYRADAAVLLLGVSYDVCTAFHLAEYRLPGKAPRREYTCFTTSQQERQKHTFSDICLDDTDFADLGSLLDAEPFVSRGFVGSAECRLFPIRAAVDFAAAWPPFLHRRRGECEETARYVLAE
jgi:aminoglycoside 3-N-acetyltransferase